MLNSEPMLDAPIPGQSLTAEPGSYPWEQPPQLNTVEEVIDKYLPMFNDEDIVVDLLNQMEAGIPITSIVRLLTRSATMNGVHSIDTGLLASPVLIEMIISIAEASDVKYTIGTEDNKGDKPRMSAISSSLAKFKEDEDVPMEEEEVTMEEPEEAPMGMMARRET
tara:strand:- start:5734 stop:6228 length:495 start_codon:yes stop_codon:yes gene_type:complete